MLRKIVIGFFCLWSLSVNAEDKTLLVLGDSLSAGYGISLQHGWVSLLQARLDEQGYRYKVVNASISGDTTRGARARLAGLLGDVQPDITIVELGGNDGLRGISLEEMHDNLSAIIVELMQSGSRVLLVPMTLPPNYGPVYIEKFRQTYDKLATSYDLVLGKFILEGIAEQPELIQADGIHPVAGAQSQMLDNLWPELKSMLEQTGL